MSKQRIVEIIEDSGNDYGQISHPDDIMKSQEFARLHTQQVTVDYLNNINPFEVAGCDHKITGEDLHFQVLIGRIYQYGGLQYEFQNSTSTLAVADSQDDRIDLIVATLSVDVPSATDFVPFQRLRTSQELASSTPPYPPTQFQRSTEKHNVAVISVKTGIPGANPVAPNPSANEVPLYNVLVEANSTEIEEGDITDLRTKVSNLAVVNSTVSNLGGDVDTLQSQMIQALAYEQQERDFTASFGRNDNLLGILQEIVGKLAVLKYRYPTIVSGDGRCPAVARDDNGTWVIDIPIGTLIEFGDGFVGIYPENFADATVNARYATVSGDDFEYLPLLDNESEAFSNNNSDGNVIRFNTLASEKTLTMKRDGSLIFRDAAQPSRADECLLLKITPDGSNQPKIKKYVNLRNGVVIYSDTYDDQDGKTGTFELDTASPVGVGYIEHFGVKASDNTRYQLPPLSIIPSQFDGEVTVPGIVDGDTWFVKLYLLSHL